jgi:hypothetical protein
LPSDSELQRPPAASPTSSDELPGVAQEPPLEEQCPENIPLASTEEALEAVPSVLTASTNKLPGVIPGEPASEQDPESTPLALTEHGPFETVLPDMPCTLSGVMSEPSREQQLPESASLALTEQSSEAAPLPSPIESSETALRASPNQIQESTSITPSADLQLNASRRVGSGDGVSNSSSNSSGSSSVSGNSSSSAENILDGVRVLRRFAGFGDFWGAVAGSRKPDGSRTWCVDGAKTNKRRSSRRRRRRRILP